MPDDLAAGLHQASTYENVASVGRPCQTACSTAGSAYNCGAVVAFSTLAGYWTYQSMCHIGQAVHYKVIALVVILAIVLRGKECCW